MLAAVHWEAWQNFSLGCWHTLTCIRLAISTCWQALSMLPNADDFMMPDDLSNHRFVWPLVFSCFSLGYLMCFVVSLHPVFTCTSTIGVSSSSCPALHISGQQPYLLLTGASTCHTTTSATLGCRTSTFTCPDCDSTTTQKLWHN